MDRRPDKFPSTTPHAPSPRIPADRLRRMIAAGTLGASVFLVQAGGAELVLRSDRICREASRANWAFNAPGCQPEALRHLLQGLSRGVVGAVRPEMPAPAGVFSMVVFVALVSAVLGLLPWRQSVPLYLLIEVVAALLFGFVGFLLVYLA